MALLRIRKSDGEIVEIASLPGAKGDKGDTGAKGNKGDTGAKGDKGDSPIKGVDYYTEADKAAFTAEAKQYTDETVGSIRAVHYTEQILTHEQKAQVRENIGAADSETVALISAKTSGYRGDGINLISLDEASPKGEWWFKGKKYTSGNASTDASCSFKVIVEPNTTYYTQLYDATSKSKISGTASYISWFDANGVFISAPASGGERESVSPEGASYAMVTFELYATATDADISRLPYMGKVDSPDEYPPEGEEITFKTLQADVDALKACKGETEGTSRAILQLPQQYYLVVGDTFELFYKGIMLCKNPYAYNILVTGAIGNVYSRKYVVTPDAAGVYPITITISDDDGNLLDEATVSLVVSEKMESPAENINVLCVGDSLTEGGEWVDEVCRRLTKTSAVTQHNATAPLGDGLTNITFVGKKTTTNAAGYEGTGGWNYGNYLNASQSGNPFAYNGAVDFAEYCSDLGITKIDRCYILLGWNMAWYTESKFKSNVKSFIDLLLAHNPLMKITLVGIEIPAYDGLGTNYKTNNNAGYNNYRGLQEFVFNVDKWNADVAADYPDNISTLSIAGQFDSENCMPTTATKVNIRSTKTDNMQNNGIHPTTEGYYQIADAVYRKFTADNA